MKTEPHASRSKKHRPPVDPSSLPFGSGPEDSFEFVNTYGTYNIQPTADTENEFPAIAEGSPESAKRDEKFDPDPPKNARK